MLSSVEGTGELYVLQCSKEHPDKYEDIVVLSKNGLEFSSPTWSHNDQRILFAMKSYFLGKIFNIFSAGISENSPLIQITDTDEDEIQPVESLDGKLVAFLRRIGKDYDVVILNLSMGEKIIVTDNINNEKLPIWIPQ